MELTTLGDRRLAALAEPEPMGTTEWLDWLCRRHAGARDLVTTSVYFIQCGGPRRPIKIGMARDPWARLATLQIANPYDLQLIATAVAPFLAEELLHKRFAVSRIRGEWFEPSAALLQFIKPIRTHEALQ
jgi:hypothetical protein